MSAPTWQILPDPITPDLESPVIMHADTGRAISVGFAGRGLTVPFQRDGKSDFRAGSSAELTRSAVSLVLGTICGSGTTQGELPWRTEFGSLVHLLRLRVNSPALAELSRSLIAQALARWVPWVQIRRIEVSVQDDRHTVRIAYDSVDPSGRVLVPGLETQVALG